MIKELTHQEDKTLNVYAPDNRTPKTGSKNRQNYKKWIHQ